MSSRTARVRLRSRINLRRKIVMLLATLAALWIFAAWVTLREGFNLLWVQTYNTTIYNPSEPLLLELQTERRMSMVYLGNASAAEHEQLVAQRHKIDELTETFQASAEGRLARLAANARLEQRVHDAVASLHGLSAVRGAVDARAVDRAAAEAAYTQVADQLFRVYFSLGQLDDADIADTVVSLIQLHQVRELISQEDALLAGSLAAGRLTGDEYSQFAQLVGAHRVLVGQIVAKLPADDQTRYTRMAAGDAAGHFASLEDQVLNSARAGLKLPFDAAQWQSATTAMQDQLLDVVLTGGKDVRARAAPGAIWVVVRLILAAGLGLLALIASIIISITTARSLLNQLIRLRDAANDLATNRLPAVVDQLRRGEQVDVRTAAPPLEFGTDEIGQVGRAFNAVQETAIRAAVDQAELRKSVRDVFVSIARRSQGLIHRQLKMLDAMEREETDAADLDALFRVDHLATRMRRNAENLIVLSGGTAGRVWRRPVPMIDVIRAATAEIEEYARVNVLPIPPAGLAGRVVGDVIHLLAELVENAASFSPPHTMVQVSGQIVSNGYVVEIEDRGLGMGETALAAANEQVRNPPDFQLSGNVRLGLYVVGRLAERHGVQVHLRQSPYGGTTAIVLIPAVLIIPQGDGEPVAADPAPLNGSAGATAEAIAAGLQAGKAAELSTGYLTERQRAAVAVMARPDDPVAAEEEPAAELVGDLAPAAPAAPQPPAGPMFGLPRRLRKQPKPAEPAASAPAAPPVDPEQARSRMAAFQRGAQQARHAPGGDGRDGDAAPSGAPAQQS
ncbi:sensor histidine kinase [Dactylosporangium sp. CA-092794]|uniref:sensor histidine kinase n=1 Tax=Dactylosporangium sp. CA-092794 TaxID=3239929 RepID=UPI003D91582D